jgi:2-polyprenyl-3-methyl-5-hydroxy-6-metoxy-1,4-benzoquinol methylase
VTGLGGGTNMNHAVDYHNELARTWEGRYDRPSFKRREQLVKSFITGQRPFASRQWIDAGCGTGRLSRVLAEQGANVIGVDAAEEMLVIAREIAAGSAIGNRLRFQHVEDVVHLPFAAGGFDGILCSSVLEYLPEPVGCLREFARVLRSGGTLIVSIPNRASMLRRAHSVEYRLTRLLGHAGLPAYMRYSKNAFGAAEFAQILADCGFTPVRSESFGGPWPKFAQRWPGLAPLILFEASRI